MDILLPALAIGVGTFVIIMAAFFISRMLARRKLSSFLNYIKQNFPDLPGDVEIFSAKQKSKSARLDIALVVDEPKKGFIILTENKGEALKHRVFSYKDLKTVNSSNKIIARGALPKTYSFEQTMILETKDGSSYNFIAEMVSNKHGNDSGADLVKNSFAPWEEKLKKILG